MILPDINLLHQRAIMKMIILTALFSAIFLFTASGHASTTCVDRSNDCPSNNSEYFNSYSASGCSALHIRDAIQAQMTFMRQPEVKYNYALSYIILHTIVFLTSTVM